MTKIPIAALLNATQPELPVQPQPPHSPPADHLNINEIYGPTVQGEGPYAGQLASFVRLAGCNLTCSWCDSAYTWDWQAFDHRAETIRYPLAELIAEVRKLPGRIIITGGEPLLQAHGLAALLSALPDRIFDLETNGTRPLADTADHWASITCSPKVIPSSNTPAGDRLDHGVIYHPRTIVKFVISDQADLDAALDCARSLRLDPSRVWLMPEGIEPSVLTERTPFVAQAAVDHGFNFTSRLHVYAWGSERGH